MLDNFQGLKCVTISFVLSFLSTNGLNNKWHSVTDTKAIFLLQKRGNESLKG